MTSANERWNYRENLLIGLWGRLARHAKSPLNVRAFIVGQLTEVLSIDWL